MQTPEARVLIVDDDRIKANDLTAMIEAVGGAVVGHIDDYEAAAAEFGSRNFPFHPDQRNVVLLDGTMRPRMHSDGSNLFTIGRRLGWLHGTQEHAPGVLAVSCSIDPQSSVSYDTGATVSDEDPAGWNRILDDHEAVPLFAPDEAIKRELLDQFEIDQALRFALGGQAVDRVAALRLSAPGEDGSDAQVLELTETELAMLTSPRAIIQAMTGRSGPKAVRKFSINPTFSATAAITTETGLVVVSRAQRPHPVYDGDIATNCAFDRIPFPTLSEIPGPYWTDHHLDPAMFIQN